MAMQAVEWNVVVAGAWNRAILTPQGVAKRLFDVSGEAGIEVQVDLDGLGPMRIVHAGLMVIPSARSLVVQPETSSLDGLVRAAEIAARAVNSLPETPLSAAGINVRFKFDALPDAAIEAGNASAFDGRLTEMAAKVVSRTTKRTLRWMQAEMNLDIIEREDGSGGIGFNFHRRSTVAEELSEWLAQVRPMHEEVLTLLRTLLGLKLPTETKPQ